MMVRNILGLSLAAVISLSGPFSHADQPLRTATRTHRSKHTEGKDSKRHSLGDVSENKVLKTSTKKKTRKKKEPKVVEAPVVDKVEPPVVKEEPKTETLPKEVVKEEPKEEKFLTLDEVKSAFQNFDISLEKDGLSVRAFGTFPEACKDLIKVKGPKNQPVEDRAGFIFADQGGFLDCVKAHKGEKLVGLGSIPGSRLETGVLDGEASLIKIGVFRYDASNEKNSEIFEAFENADGKALTYETAAYLQRKAEVAKEEKLQARIDKLKKSIEKCQGSLKGLKVANKSLDELLSIDGVTQAEYDRLRGEMATNELFNLKKRAERTGAKSIDETLELLGSFAARFPEKHDALAEIYSNLANKFLNKEGAEAEDFSIARQILDEADDVLTDASPNSEKKLKAAGMSIKSKLILARAQGGSTQDPMLGFEIQNAQFQATNDVLRYCGMGGLGSMGGAMSMGGATGGMNLGMSGFQMPGNKNQKPSVLCAASQQSLQNIQSAQPMMMAADYQAYQQYMQYMQYMQRMQSPMMLGGMPGAYGMGMQQQGFSPMMMQQQGYGPAQNPMLTGYGSMSNGAGRAF